MGRGRKGGRSFGFRQDAFVYEDAGARGEGWDEGAQEANAVGVRPVEEDGAEEIEGCAYGRGVGG